MFNEVSHDAARQALTDHPALHAMLPFFDIMYQNANKCYYIKPDGNTAFFTQHEGFPQGDPLAPILSALTVNILLHDLHQDLLQRAKARLTHTPGDDGYGSRSASTSYVDDTNLFLAYDDLLFYLQTFERKGKKLGIKLNRSKTKILTLPNDHPHATHLTTSQEQHLSAALQFLYNPSLPPNQQKTELRCGTKLLGQPIGTKTFINQYLAAAATNFAHDLYLLSNRLKDDQTKGSLSKTSALASLAHFLAADVYTNLDAPEHLAHWSSPFISQLEHTSAEFLTDLIGSYLPPHAQMLLHLPLKQGGLGLRDHSEAAIPAFLVPMLRSIQYATTGIPCHPDPFKPPSNDPDVPASEPTLHHVPTIYARPLASWQTTRSPSTSISAFRTLLPIFIQEYNHDPLHADNPLDQPTALALDPKNLQSYLYHRIMIRVQATITSNLPIHIHNILPSLLNPLTSLPLHSLTRHLPNHRLTPHLYRLLIHRKLRLPLLPLAPTCRHCQKHVDIYGDHLFACKGYSKTPLHNQLRDTVCNVLTHTSTLGAFTDTTHDVLLEPTNLLPEYPNRRPADIALRLHTPTANCNTIAIDVTCTSPVAPSTDDPLLSSSTTTLPSSPTEAHHHCLRKKINNRIHSGITNVTITQALHTNKIALIPFTLDPYGGLGYFGHHLLFRTKASPLRKPPHPNFTSTAFSHPDAYTAFTTAAHTDLGIVSTATDAWREQQQPGRNIFFGPTYQTPTPTAWATQILALNISLALHVQRSLSSLRTTPTTKRPTHLTTGFFLSRGEEITNP